MGRTDRRPRRRLDADTRRAAILQAAASTFAQGSYQQVSVAAVAAAAGASEALVLRYFRSKAGLYVAVVRSAIETLLRRQAEADAALGPAAGHVERISTSVRVYLEYVAAFPRGWAAPLRAPYGEPPEAAQLRAELRTHYVGLLRQLLGPGPDRPRELALYGYLGFLDAACLDWADADCPDGERDTIVAMALGALRGALDAAATEPATRFGS